MTQKGGDLDRKVRGAIADPVFRDSLESLLTRMLSVDTSPAQPLGDLAKSEAGVFDMISRYLGELGELPGTAVKHPIAEEIEAHPFYTKVHPYPAGSEIPASAVYSGRYNLVYRVDSPPVEGGRNVGLNAHIDVVSPYFPPERQADRITGRGSVDDKGGVAVILGALRVLDALVKDRIVGLSGRITAMFVIDEELGGNGSLSVAMDRELRRDFYDSVLVLECAGKQIYPGNRGAVFITIGGVSTSAPGAESSSRWTEALAFGILGIIDEGRKIREESDHPQFPHKPVYTCPGILGHFGKHPSGICDYVEFILSGVGEGEESKIANALGIGIDRYVGIFGDKRNVIDSLTGAPKIVDHYTLSRTGADTFRVEVYGSGGHMGSLPQNDAAITKWAYLVRELVILKHQEGLRFEIRLGDSPGDSGPRFEGAQSFLPDHNVAGVARRMEQAFYRGVAEYESMPPAAETGIEWNVSFDKLHNEAFATDPESRSVRNAVASAIDAGMIDGEPPLVGWDASCDARIFALEYPGLPVITTGPGDLNGAHSEKESLYLPDLYEGIHFVVMYILRETSSIDTPELTE